MKQITKLRKKKQTKQILAKKQKTTKTSNLCGIGSKQTAKANKQTKKRSKVAVTFFQFFFVSLYPNNCLLEQGE